MTGITREKIQELRALAEGSFEHVGQAVFGDRELLFALLDLAESALWRPIEEATELEVNEDVIVVGGRHKTPKMVPADPDWWLHEGPNGCPVGARPTHFQRPMTQPGEGE